MDSPDAAKNNFISTAIADVAASSESPPVQESPFFSYVNNLSPIKSVKASRVAQDFHGFNSPPIVFTSPRINPHCGSQFLERPQCSQSATVGISQSDNGGKSLADDPDGSKKSSSLLLVKFISDNQKDFDIKNDANTQHCSSSPCVESVDKYLADPADIDCMYSGSSVNPDVKLSTDSVESSSLNDLTHSKETILKFDDKNGPSDKVKEPLHLSEESIKNYQEKPTSDDETRKVGKKKDVEWPSQECAESECTLHADLVFEKQCCDDSLFQDVKDCEGCSGMGPTSYVSEQNISQEGSKANQKHRGLLRRCLQFEDAASNAFGSLNSSLLPTHVPEDSKPSATSDSKKTYHVALHVASSDNRMVKLSKPITSLFSPNCSGNFLVTGSKPSGIGLHLNSIVNAMPHSRPALTGMRLAEGCMDSQGMKSVTPLSCHKVEDIERGLNSSNMEGKSSVDNEDKRYERNASIAADSHTSESPRSIESPNLLIRVEPHASVHDERKLRSVNDGNLEDSNQTSPKRKRKRTSETADDDGCKRCNCKKSKCLKLYCDCFAAGLYCAEPCACQGCFNKPEYEDLVLETRQQIESRNPLAFAPKIVSCAIDLPSSNVEDANLTTPSSARHKRGCNCKKSMCLKKYCECYQANVGCSGGCRCEGCKNVYGRKEDYFVMEHGSSKEGVRSRVEEGSDSMLHNKLEMAAQKKDLLDGEFYDPHHLSPLTPSLQCSDQGKQAPNFRAPSGRYLPAPEMLRNASNDGQQACNNREITDQSTPRCSSVANVNELTHSNSQSMSSASFSSKTRDPTHVRHVLSGGSLRWRSSPITPMTKLGETKSQKCLESGSRLYDILEDETPDVLKEASTPIKSVKASSPKQKRVSPPQGNLRELGSGSSGGLRSGRKFILKAVPSFPPLTPCIDSKRNDHEDSGTSTSKQVTDDPKSRRVLPM